MESHFEVLKLNRKLVFFKDLFFAIIPIRVGKFSCHGCVRLAPQRGCVNACKSRAGMPSDCPVPSGTKGNRRG